MKTLRRVLISILRIVLAVAIVGAVLLLAFQDKLIYHPRAYQKDDLTTWSARPGNLPIRYESSAGAQVAYLQAPMGKQSRNLWIVCPGNETLALQWSSWMETHAPAQDAFLLTDPPGYGECQGRPHPDTILAGLKKVIPLAVEKLGWDTSLMPGRLRFFGHSLGAASALMAAAEFKIAQGIIIAPFTSTVDMAQVVMHLPVGFLVWHRFDNVKSLQTLADSVPGAVVESFHGDRDAEIPFSMCEKLQRLFPSLIRFHPITGAGHDDVVDVASAEIGAAMAVLAK